VPEDQRGTASGYYAIMSQIATLAGAFICGKMVSANLHVQTFALVGGVYLLFVLIAMFATPEPQVRFEGPKLELVPYLKSLWIDPKTYPDFAWVWITRALMMLGFYLILPYLLFYLRDVVHLPDPASEVGTIMGIILLAAGISGFVGGVISDRFGRKRVVIASSLIVAATCLFFPFCSNQIQLLLTGLIFGIGYGTYISVDWALATDVLPSKEDAAKDMGIWHVSMTLPQNVAPLIGGAMILENFKAGTVMDQGEKVAVYGWTGYLILFIVSCVFFGLGGILIKKVKGST
jgi:MFS family permease